MKSLNNPVCDRMIGGYAYASRAQQLCQLCPEPRFKLTSPISCDGRRGAKPSYPSTHEGLCNTLSCNVGNRNCLWPTGESVDASKQVGEAPGWWEGSDNINVNHVETCIRRGEGGKWITGTIGKTVPSDTHQLSPWARCSS